MLMILIKILRNLLGETERHQLNCHFHPDAVTLSAMIRDPKNDDRGIITLTPRWAADTEPHSRVYCVVEKWAHRAIFNKIYGSMLRMSQNDSKTLQEVCEQFSIE